MTPPAPNDSSSDIESRPTFAEALRFWSRLGWISFGGPTGQIAIMHRELVDLKKWVDEKRFLNALNYCMMLPGPEAQQLATYIGWYLHGIRGGICAGLLFILPAIFILWGLSLTYVWYGTVPLVAAAFHGLAPAVIAVVFHAMLRLGRKTLHNPLRWAIAIAAAVLIYFYRDAYPLVVLGAALLGWLFRKKSGDDSPSSTESKAESHPIKIAPLLRIAACCLALWFTPLLILGTSLGWNHTVAQEGIFFSKAALVTFGGAYAVLPYVARHAVEHYHWLSGDQMLHGFGLAETTPGPLIMVLQFVGFLGAWRHPGTLSPLLAATLGSFITSWVTFAPSFLFILVGAPFVERLAPMASIRSVLSAISAAVVGVMANFAFWFAWHAIFPMESMSRPDLFVLFVSLGSFATLYLWKVDLMLLIGLCAALGVIYRILL
jgi:chromate transporter